MEETFKFNFQVTYCDEVENRLYKDTCIPQHFIQRRSESIAFCLMCRLFLPCDTDSIKQHFVDVVHEDNEYLDTYHMAFMNQSMEVQSQQIFFSPCLQSQDSVFCEVCVKNINKNTVSSHLCDSKHFERKCKYPYWPEFVKIEEGNSIRDDSAVEITEDNIKLLGNIQSNLIFTKIGQRFICLLCKGQNVVSLKNHLLFSNHSNVKNEKYIYLTNFHKFWNEIDVETAKSLKKFFYPIDLKKVYCLICNSKINYSAVKEHVAHFPCTFLHVNSPLRDTEMDWTKLYDDFLKRQFTFPYDYGKEVLEILYPLHETLKDNSNVPTYIMQKRNGNQRCLVCRNLLIDVSTDDVLQHLQSDQHHSCEFSKLHLFALKSYHDFWMKQPIKLQLIQHNFYPFKPNIFKCSTCKEKIKIASVFKHMGENCTEKRKVPIQESQSEIKTMAYYPTLQNSDASSSSTPENEIDGSNNNNNNNNKTLPLMNAKVQAQTLPKLKGTYSRNLIAAIFGKYNEKDTYYIQKRGRNDFYCTLCRKNVIQNASLHVENRKHKQKVKNPTFAEVYCAYHDYWMKTEEPENQVNFEPLSVQRVACVDCTEPLLFADIQNHSCNPGDTKGEVAKEFQITVKYTKSVMSKLYSQSFLDICFVRLATLMPVGNHCGGRINCFLCGKKLLRDLKVWKRHLEVLHINPTPERDALLQKILVYHKFFMLLRPEHQFVQVYFQPHNLVSAKCNNKHIVPYDKLIEHAKTCKFEQILKFPLPYLSGGKELEVLATRLNTLKLENEDEHWEYSKEMQELVNSVGSVEIQTKPEHSKEGESSPSSEDTQNRSPNVLQSPKKFKKKMDNVNTKQPKDVEKQERVHDVIPAVDNANSTNIFELIPQRLRFNISHLSATVTCIRCSLCDVLVRNDIKELLHHLSHQSHIGRLKPKNIYDHHCEICDVKIKKESMWLNHLDSHSHSLKVTALGVKRIQNLNEYECTTCHCVIFGDQLSIIRHQQLFKNKRERKNYGGKVVLAADAKAFLQTPATANVVLKKLLQDSDEALRDTEALKFCLSALELALSKKYPNCKAYPFGSRVTGIGTINSDLDVFVDIGGRYKGENYESQDQQKIIMDAKKIFLENKKIFMDVYARPAARTPIIQVIHIPTDIDCDVSFRNGLSVENTKYIRFCIDIQPVFRPVMLLLKYWSDLVSLKDEVCSYALCMMLVFQMQLDNLLIPVHQLRQLTEPNAPKIEGWDIIVYNRPIQDLQKYIKIPDSVNPFQMLKNFFKYYQNFDFRRFVICPLLGRPIPISNFTDDETGKALPIEMETYVEKLAVDPDCQFRAMAAMFVQDPFDLGHNLTKVVPKHLCEKIKKLCALSIEQMKG